MKRKIRTLLNKTKDGTRAVRDKLPIGTEPPVREHVPRITNNTVAVHREEVLSSARKYIYPLQHSKNRIVIITTSLVVAFILGFFGYCTIALYKFQSDNSFIYRVTEVIPFPIARVGSRWVTYESYLFQLRHYVHYYETQQKLNFSTNPSAKAQLLNYKHRALTRVIDDAYIKQLAAEHHIAITEEAVQNEINLARSENRLGNNNTVLENVLKNQWGWSINDFRRALRSQLLEEKVVSALDTGTHQRAQSALAQLNKGVDFGKLASQVSEDASTKQNGGQYGFLINQTNRDISPQVIAALYKLKPGQHSGIINAGYSLEIVKLISREGNQLKAAHIVFNFKNITTYIAPLRAKEPYTAYITLPKQ